MTIGSLITVADDITIDRPTKVLTRTNELGVPTAEVLIPDVITGSMTLQLPDAASAAPALGATFTLHPVGGGTTGNFKVSKTGDKFSAAGETKIMVEFRQKFAAAA